MDDKTTGIKAVLEAALHNAKVVQDQLKSLRDDHAVKTIEKQVQRAIDAIDKELNSLG